MRAPGQLIPASPNAHGRDGGGDRMVKRCEHRLQRDGVRPRIEETLPVWRAPHAEHGRTEQANAHPDDWTGRARPARCPVEAALEVLDDRWKTLIVWRLYWGARPFCDLMRGTTGITKKTLRRQLAELERHGLVHRRLRPGGHRRAEYSLTPFGETLKPIVGQIYVWGLSLLDAALVERRSDVEDGAGTS
jgi:DNA-binding HxlR family transcriptional regulator